MTQERALQDSRGLRFSIDAPAEVVVEGHSESIHARVTELSLRGCFLEISGAWKEHQRLRVKISHGQESFESAAQVIYVRPKGIGVMFGEMQPQARHVLQGWIVAAMDDPGKSKHS
jgi:hypothetical protein